jgi:putative membrane protein (TIGR04086 family)
MKKIKRAIPPVAFAEIVHISILILLSAIFSFFVLNSSSPSHQSFILSLIILPLTAVLGAFFTGKFKSDFALKECLIASLSISLIIILISAFFSEKGLSGQVLINVLVFNASGALSSYLLRPRKRRHRR